MLKGESKGEPGGGFFTFASAAGKKRSEAKRRNSAREKTLAVVV